MSQTNLAIYLSISVSLLKMVEANKRELPRAAALKAAYLQQYAIGNIEKEDVTNTILPEKETNKVIKELNQYVRRLEIQLQKSRHQLQKLQTSYQQATNRTRLMQYIQSTLQPGDEGEKDRLWLDILQAETKIALRKTNRQVQALLQWKIDCYTYSINNAAETLEAMELL